MMDWTRLVSNLLKLITKKLPRDCVLQGYMFASLREDELAGRRHGGRRAGMRGEAGRPGRGREAGTQARGVEATIVIIIITTIISIKTITYY